MEGAQMPCITNPNSDPLSPKNYYLISLLNVDLKVFTSIKAHSINRCLQAFVEWESFQLIKAKIILDNAENREKLPMMILALDIEKAFDIVLWPFLFAVFYRSLVYPPP